MKAKLRLLEVGLLTIVMILDANLVNSSTITNEYRINKMRSTANYIQVDMTDELAHNEYTKEELEPIIVYDGLTLEELASKLNKSLNSTISGKGELIASYSIEKGVDPYLATAIMLHETGCKWECSYLVRKCNNVGGQKGSGCGAYKSYDSLDDGIRGFIDNIYNNYVSYGLLTSEQMNSKYAEDKNWSVNVNKYIETIKAQ